MPDIGVLISVPMESVAVRATVGSLVALGVVALLLRSGLRVPRIRSAAVLLPMVALVSAVALSWNDLVWPTLMTTSSSSVVQGLRAGNGYLSIAPIGLPLLAGTWALVAGLRVARRLHVLRRMSLVADAGGAPRDLRVRRTLLLVAARLRVPAPRVVVVQGCPGGALVVGVRQPAIVVDADLLASLDNEELEGLLAHELAHIRRRDNLLGLAVGLIRDVCFFVPGGRWVARRLCAERELAADQIAVGVTSRPGALASGLLKVIDNHRPSVACAAFAAPAAVVARVERLVADAPSSTRGRAVAESAALAGVLTLAVAAGVQLPASVVGQPGAGEALAFVWAWQQADPLPEAAAQTAFSSFLSSTPQTPAPVTASSRPVERGREFHPSILRGERVTGSAVRLPGGVRARAQAVESGVLNRWRASPLVTSDGGAGVYWLRRLETVR